MTSKTESLAEKIRDHARKYWEEHQKPLLLSQLGAMLKNDGVDYQATLDGESLRAFIMKDTPDLSIKQHPSQFAKIGVTPSEAEYSFELPSVATEAAAAGKPDLRKSRQAYYNFIKAISHLPKDELDSISIPTSVVVRLLEGK